MTAHNQTQAACNDTNVAEQLQDKKATLESKRAQVAVAKKELEAVNAEDSEGRKAIEKKIEEVVQELQKEEEAFEKMKNDYPKSGDGIVDPMVAEQIAAANAALDFDFDSMLKEEEGVVETMAKNHGTRSARKVVQQWFINTFSSALTTWRSKSAQLRVSECKHARVELKAQASQIEGQASRILDMEEHLKTLENTNATINERLKYAETMFSQTRTEMHDARKQLVNQTQRADALEEELNHTIQAKDLALEEFEQINSLMVKIQYENDENRKEKGRLSNQLILLK
jgi:hypothetical protein